MVTPGDLVIIRDKMPRYLYPTPDISNWIQVGHLGIATREEVMILLALPSQFDSALVLTSEGELGWLWTFSIAGIP